MLEGDMSVEEIEERLGITIEDGDVPNEAETFRKAFKETRQSDISDGVEEDRWHCFEHPFVIVAGDNDTCSWIYHNLLPFVDQMSEVMTVIRAEQMGLLAKVEKGLSRLEETFNIINALDESPGGSDKTAREENEPNE